MPFSGRLPAALRQLCSCCFLVVVRLLPLAVAGWLLFESLSVILVALLFS
jgi:hypothetical protein